MYLAWIGKVILVIMNCPLINHDNRVLGDKESFIPVILDDIVICPEFVDWAPSEGFLPSDQMFHSWEWRGFANPAVRWYDGSRSQSRRKSGTCLHRLWNSLGHTTCILPHRPDRVERVSRLNPPIELQTTYLNQTPNIG